MDSIAPYKTKEKRPNVQPWLNEQTRALRQECRRAERKWNKDKLHISLQMLRNSLIKYQKAVKYYKASYFANNSPRKLFTIINRHLRPCTKLILTPS